MRSLDLPPTTRHSPVKVYTDATVQDGLAVGGAVIVTHGGRIEPVGCHIGSVGTERAEREIVSRVLDNLDVAHVKVYTDFEELAETPSPNLFYDFDYGTIEWVPRERNRAADAVAAFYSSQPVAPVNRYNVTD